MAAAWKYFEEIQTINTVGEGGGGRGLVGAGGCVCRGCSCSLFREMVWIKVWTGTCRS